MSFLQLRYYNRDIELTKPQRRTIYRDARRLWWKRRRLMGNLGVDQGVSKLPFD